MLDPKVIELQRQVNLLLSERLRSIHDSLEWLNSPFVLRVQSGETITWSKPDRFKC